MNTTCDFLIIGGGIIGLCAARELRLRYPQKKIILIEKESSVGQHASGRNSGVLHAGFYYSQDSMKAKFCRLGNEEMRNLCQENQLSLNPCGKIVSARNASEYQTLKELFQRGTQNDVPLQWLDRRDLESIDSNILSYEKALYSPSTASVNPREICAFLSAWNLDHKVSIRLGERFTDTTRGGLLTDKDRYDCGYVLNCAGAYADKVAGKFGFARDKVLIPFRGRYMVWNQSKNPGRPVNINLYPVPDMKFPFLGVHFTVTSDGTLKIGPTASPAYWRENYLGFSGFSLREFLENVFWQISLFFHNSFGFRRLAWEEVRKWRAAYLLKQGASLLKHGDTGGFDRFAPSGIRAQLLDTRLRTLVSDFLLEGDSKSMHVLNAVSPAFTCSLPFVRCIVDNIDNCLNGRKMTTGTASKE